MTIRKISEDDERTGKFIRESFLAHAAGSGVSLNYDEFCFIAENDREEILGAVTGRAYYNEVHIGDLIVDENPRGQNIGSRLVKTVEDAYRNKGYEKITLTTFGFQAPGFYEKRGYSAEFVREDGDPRLSKFFFVKKL